MLSHRAGRLCCPGGRELSQDEPTGAHFARVVSVTNGGSGRPEPPLVTAPEGTLCRLPGLTWRQDLERFAPEKCARACILRDFETCRAREPSSGLKRRNRKKSATFLRRDPTNAGSFSIRIAPAFWCFKKWVTLMTHFLKHWKTTENGQNFEPRARQFGPQ